MFCFKQEMTRPRCDIRFLHLGKTDQYNEGWCCGVVCLSYGLQGQHSLWLQVAVPAASLLMQLPVHTTGKEAEDSPGDRSLVSMETRKMCFSSPGLPLVIGPSVSLSLTLPFKRKKKKKNSIISHIFRFSKVVIFFKLWLNIRDKNDSLDNFHYQVHYRNFLGYKTAIFIQCKGPSKIPWKVESKRNYFVV